ncbi:MAG: nucleotidyltransferase family protein [Calditrichales bacterium]|nr:MAG: nucleotidyltransferase family protein [Calditrichales bacterium]
MKRIPIAGVVLAAGDSTRMGKPKALLPLGESSFITVVLENMDLAGFEPLVVVLGTDYLAIKKKLPSLPTLSSIQNPFPEKGQLSSLQLAIKKLPMSSAGCLVALVDHPLVSSPTYKIMFTAALNSPDCIVIPAFKGQRGHPVYFGRCFFEELLATPLDAGARQVVRNHAQSVIELPVDDPGILKDIDTPEIYRDHIG